MASTPRTKPTKFNPNALEVECLHKGTADLANPSGRVSKILADSKATKTNPGCSAQTNIKKDFSVYRLPNGDIVWVSMLVPPEKDGRVCSVGVMGLPANVTQAYKAGSSYIASEKILLPTCLIKSMEAKAAAKLMGKARPPMAAAVANGEFDLDSDGEEKSGTLVMPADDPLFNMLAKHVEDSRPADRHVPTADPSVMIQLAGAGYATVVGIHRPADLLPVQRAGARCALLGLANPKHPMASVVTSCRDGIHETAQKWAAMLARNRDDIHPDDVDVGDSARVAANSAYIAASAVLQAAALRIDEMTMDLAAANMRTNMVQSTLESKAAECDRLRAEVRALTSAKRKLATEERTAKKALLPLDVSPIMPDLASAMSI